jgi:FAD/FMN-containing dehydrogenase
MLVLTVFPLLLAVVPTQAAVLDLQKRSSLTDCLTAASVPQNAPGSADFKQAIKPFNLRIPFTPIAVAVPTTVAQVQAAVACGVSNNATISPKSGGHSYASHGLGGEDGHFMIDMKMFNSVSVDSSTGIASIGPGGRLGNIAQSLFSQGQRAFSHGTCPGYLPLNSFFENSN